MDEMEFERRARACTDRLFRVCYAILPDRADREDAIQEALIKAWRRVGTLKDEAARGNLKNALKALLAELDEAD